MWGPMTNKRIEPPFVFYSVDIALPDQTKNEINRLSGVVFSADEFREMEEALAVCVGTWEARKQSPGKGNVLGRLNEIGEVARRLAQLLIPSLDADHPTRTSRMAAAPA